MVLHTLGGGADPQRVARTEVDPAAGVVRASRVLGRPVTLARGTRLSVDCTRLDRKALRRVEPPGAEITALALSADEREVAAGLAAGRVLRWRTDG